MPITTDALWQSIFGVELNSTSSFVVDNALLDVFDTYEGYGEAWQYLFPLVTETVFFGMCCPVTH